MPSLKSITNNVKSSNLNDAVNKEKDKLESESSKTLLNEIEGVLNSTNVNDTKSLKHLGDSLTDISQYIESNTKINESERKVLDQIVKEQKQIIQNETSLSTRLGKTVQEKGQSIAQRGFDFQASTLGVMAGSPMLAMLLGGAQKLTEKSIGGVSNIIERRKQDKVERDERASRLGQENNITDNVKTSVLTPTKLSSISKPTENSNPLVPSGVSNDKVSIESRMETKRSSTRIYKVLKHIDDDLHKLIKIQGKGKGKGIGLDGLSGLLKGLGNALSKLLPLLELLVGGIIAALTALKGLKMWLGRDKDKPKRPPPKPDPKPDPKPGKKPIPGDTDTKRIGKPGDTGPDKLWGESFTDPDKDKDTKRIGKPEDTDTDKKRIGKPEDKNKDKKRIGKPEDKNKDKKRIGKPEDTATDKKRIGKSEQNNKNDEKTKQKQHDTRTTFLKNEQTRLTKEQKERERLAEQEKEREKKAQEKQREDIKKYQQKKAYENIFKKQEEQERVQKQKEQEKVQKQKEPLKKEPLKKFFEENNLNEQTTDNNKTSKDGKNPSSKFAKVNKAMGVGAQALGVLQIDDNMDEIRSFMEGGHYVSAVTKTISSIAQVLPSAQAQVISLITDYAAEIAAKKDWNAVGEMIGEDLNNVKNVIAERLEDPSKLLEDVEKFKDNVVSQFNSAVETLSTPVDSAVGFVHKLGEATSKLGQVAGSIVTDALGMNAPSKYDLQGVAKAPAGDTSNLSAAINMESGQSPAKTVEASMLGGLADTIVNQTKDQITTVLKTVIGKSAQKKEETDNVLSQLSSMDNDWQARQDAIQNKVKEQQERFAQQNSAEGQASTLAALEERFPQMKEERLAAEEDAKIKIEAMAREQEERLKQEEINLAKIQQQKIDDEIAKQNAEKERLIEEQKIQAEQDILEQKKKQALLEAEKVESMINYNMDLNAPSTEDTNRISSAINMESGQEPAQSLQSSMMGDVMTGAKNMLNSASSYFQEDPDEDDFGPRDTSYDSSDIWNNYDTSPNMDKGISDNAYIDEAAVNGANDGLYELAPASEGVSSMFEELGDEVISLSDNLSKFGSELYEQTNNLSITPGGGFSPLSQTQRREINDDIINNKTSTSDIQSETSLAITSTPTSTPASIIESILSQDSENVEPKDTDSGEYWKLQNELDQDKIRQDEEQLDRIAQERIEIENAKRIKIAADEALAKQEQKRALEAWLYQDEENKRIQAEEDEKERVNQENIENIRLTEEASEREKERLELERIQKEEQAEFDRQEAEEAAEFARILKAEDDAQAAKQLAVEEERARQKEKERLESIAEDARIEAARIKYNEAAVARWKAEAAEEAKRNDWVKIQKAQQKQQREKTFTSVNFAQQALDKMATRDNSSSSAYNNNSSYNNQQTSSNITNNYNNEAQSGYPSYMFANQDDD